MNPLLSRLQPYPFERLRRLFADVTPSANHSPISLGIGEPRHDAPSMLKQALAAAIDKGLSGYPATAGDPALRQACAAWLQRRYGVTVDPATQVLPVNGSREALFAFAQTVLDPTRPGALLACPDPFYQIYEGAALLAGATPWYLPQRAANGFRCDWDAVPAEVWSRTRLVYLCTPGNPTGVVTTLDEWRALFALADRHGFVIASDECYSEIYFDESAPPLGALQAARELGRGFERLVVFSSLSKRSNAPGLRSGFVAGDAGLLERFLRYRTYHGSAMSLAVQAASVAAWQDEAHVTQNRRLYRDKFDAVVPIVAEALQVRRPEAGFYLWLAVPDGDDTRFAWRLNHELNTLVLPGSFLGRAGAPDATNPGAGFVRVALVEDLDACVEGARRICALVRAG